MQLRISIWRISTLSVISTQSEEPVAQINIAHIAQNAEEFLRDKNVGHIAVNNL